MGCHIFENSTAPKLGKRGASSVPKVFQILNIKFLKFWNPHIPFKRNKNTGTSNTNTYTNISHGRWFATICHYLPLFRHYLPLFRHDSPLFRRYFATVPLLFATVSLLFRHYLPLFATIGRNYQVVADSGDWWQTARQSIILPLFATVRNHSGSICHYLPLFRQIVVIKWRIVAE